MAKIYLFYISNIKNELAYEEDDKIDSNETQSKNRTILNISNHIVQVLIIEKMFNLKTVGKILNKNSDNDDTDNEVDSENSSIDSSNSTSDDGSKNELKSIKN
ncbi:hypothetical protein RhiirC2_789833 [Rhizophagus irregularis]|uniref:Uncharacterized protein n=1 Tax=Rhizophagus irregularis TaxID=588596 RepID=A0A2N1MMG3_9GLOM|nr:hypothetical protein RhiirC2_789833 [Rhizophagus irregularis]